VRYLGIFIYPTSFRYLLISNFRTLSCYIILCTLFTSSQHYVLSFTVASTEPSTLCNFHADNKVCRACRRRVLSRASFLETSGGGTDRSIRIQPFSVVVAVFTQIDSPEPSFSLFYYVFLISSTQQLLIQGR
jgi:hypothetical protein